MMDPEFCSLHPGARIDDYVCLIVRGELGSAARSDVSQDSTRKLEFALSMGYGIVKQYGGYLWVVRR
jgi:hypothetical protein